MTNNLKFYRELRGFTQEDVATFVGISRNSISSIERGVYLPTLRNAFLIARSLYVPIHLLFDFSDEMTIYNEVVHHEGLDNPLLAAWEELNHES